MLKFFKINIICTAIKKFEIWKNFAGNNFENIVVKTKN